MSRKMTCPGCNSHTGEVARAFESDEPCPSCGLPAEAAMEVYSARQRYADADLTSRYEEMVIRAGRAEAEVEKLKAKLDRVRHALDDDEQEPSWERGWR